MKTNEFTDFIKQKIAELKEDELFDAVRAQYPDVSTREIMRSLSILLGGDVIYDENK
ncbi:MAG: hypothetical protein WCL34_09125 [Methylococcaceae bacterium]|jgi:hypothetical protein